MGEQTILCGMLQTGSLLCYDKMIEQGIDDKVRFRYGKFESNWFNHGEPIEQLLGDTVDLAAQSGGGAGGPAGDPGRDQLHALGVDVDHGRGVHGLAGQRTEVPD